MKANISLNPSRGKIIMLPEVKGDGDLISDQLAVTSGNTIKLISVDLISYFQSENNYTHLILTSGKRILSSKTMKRFENRIDAVQFLRVHKSYIINTQKISSFDTSENKLELNDGSQIPVSRSRKSTLVRYLKTLMV